ncbi:hypothetical protein MRX96_025520 [Rhipicephalus microplus]
MLSALLLAAVTTYPLLARASVQTPTLKSCSSSEKVMLSDVSIRNAKLNQKMTVNFSITINEPLESNPKLQVTLTKKDGREVVCLLYIGSCTYNLCGKSNIVEQTLGESWGNKCPVPATALQKTVDVPLPSLLGTFIGKLPTTLTVRLNVTNGGKTVGCQFFKVDIAGV